MRTALFPAQGPPAAGGETHNRQQVQKHKKARRRSRAFLAASGRVGKDRDGEKKVRGKAGLLPM